MTHLTLTIAHYLQSPINEFLQSVGNMFTKIAQHRKHQQAIRELNSLSDYQLRDMGISRGDIYSVVRGDKDMARHAEVNANLKGFV